MERPWTSDDYIEERVWRHLGSCQFMTYCTVPPPASRAYAPLCVVSALAVGDGPARFTTLFERPAIEVLQATDIASPPAFCASAGMRPGHVLARAVERRRRAKPARVTPYIGVDERAVAKGHQYLAKSTRFE